MLPPHEPYPRQTLVGLSAAQLFAHLDNEADTPGPAILESSPADFVSAEPPRLARIDGHRR
jgi:hypothetical protein